MRGKIKALHPVGQKDSLSRFYAVIYGNFIQRLGFSSGGFSQDIRIVNVETGEIFSFIVKPTLSSKKENTFCFGIIPGTYEIYNYMWTKSTAIGAVQYTEPVFKGLDSEKLDEKIKAEEIMQTDLVRYRFTVRENTLCYMGTWHFNTGLVSFTDTKNSLDGELKARYKRLDFSTAITVLPE